MKQFKTKQDVHHLEPGTVLNAIVRGVECTRVVATVSSTALRFTNGACLYLDGPGLRIKDGRLQMVVAGMPAVPGSEAIPERVTAEYWPA